MNESPPRPITATLVLLGCVGVLAAHFATLYTSGQDPIATPVAALSHSVDGNLHGLGLSLFAMAQIALAALLNRRGVGWATRVAQLLLAVNAVLIVQIAWQFAGTGAGAPRPPEPTDPLSLLASGTGLAMSFAAPGLFEHHRPAGVWNLACLIVWLALVPLGFAVEASWIGAYERFVGAAFVAWAAGLAVLLGFVTPRAAGGRHGAEIAASPAPGRTANRPGNT